MRFWFLFEKLESVLNGILTREFGIELNIQVGGYILKS